MLEHQLEAEEARRYDARALTEVATRLRHVMAAGIRAVLPSEILPMAQADILQRLAEAPLTRVSDLASRSKLAVNTISTLVNQLAEAQLVSRQRDSKDGRVVLLSLTGEGEKKLTEWLSVMEELMASAITRLDQDQQDQLRTAIPALIALTSSMEGVYDETLGEAEPQAVGTPSTLMQR